MSLLRGSIRNSIGQVGRTHARTINKLIICPPDNRQCTVPFSRLNAPFNPKSKYSTKSNFICSLIGRGIRFDGWFSVRSKLLCPLSPSDRRRMARLLYVLAPALFLRQGTDVTETDRIFLEAVSSFPSGVGICSAFYAFLQHEHE
jgi:hypothetical protein